MKINWNSQIKLQSWSFERLGKPSKLISAAFCFFLMIERDRERQKETERGRERQRETERDRERQRESEIDRERQRETDREGQIERDR